MPHIDINVTDVNGTKNINSEERVSEVKGIDYGADLNESIKEKSIDSHPTSITLKPLMEDFKKVMINKITELNCREEMIAECRRGLKSYILSYNSYIDEIEKFISNYNDTNKFASGSYPAFNHISYKNHSNSDILNILGHNFECLYECSLIPIRKECLSAFSIMSHCIRNCIYGGISKSMNTLIEEDYTTVYNLIMHILTASSNENTHVKHVCKDIILPSSFDKNYVKLFKYTAPLDPNDHVFVIDIFKKTKDYNGCLEDRNFIHNPDYLPTSLGEDLDHCVRINIGVVSNTTDKTIIENDNCYYLLSLPKYYKKFIFNPSSQELDEVGSRYYNGPFYPTMLKTTDLIECMPFVNKKTFIKHDSSRIRLCLFSYFCSCAVILNSFSIGIISSQMLGVIGLLLVIPNLLAYYLL